jgi:hypothetical protein
VRIFYNACEIGFRALGALGIFTGAVNVSPVTFIELFAANGTGGYYGGGGHCLNN